MNKIKHVTTWLLLLCMVLTMASCGSGSEETDTVISNSSKPVEVQNDAAPVELTPEEVEAKEQFANSTPENDTDVGLKNIKIDTAEMSLSDEQEAVIKYFDDDYLYVPSYEFLRRYPNVFTGAQLTIWGSIKKVISMDAENYEAVLWLNVGHAELEYPDISAEYEGDYILITGETGQAWFMEGDTLKIYGRYSGVETVTIDGTSYTIPKVTVHDAYFDTSTAPNDIYRYIQKFDMGFVKKVASTVFGNDIEVRKPIADVDVPMDILAMQLESGVGDGETPYYVVEREDQSNAKFSKFFFYTSTDNDAWGGKRIAVAKDTTAYNTPIERSVEFAADFSHFFMFTYDTDLETLTLEYYDSNLNKMWKREFEETTTAMYDYTKNNIYLAANNELYIINIETGEDTYAPSYVGAKKAIRKLNDGILMISESKSDGVMKAGLDGHIIWKTNLQEDTYSVDGVQLIDRNIVVQQYYWNDPSNSGTHFIVLNSEDGSVIADAVSIAPAEEYYDFDF